MPGVALTYLRDVLPLATVAAAARFIPSHSWMMSSKARQFAERADVAKVLRTFDERFERQLNAALKDSPD